MKGPVLIRPFIFFVITALLGFGLTQKIIAAEHYNPLTLTCGGAQVTLSCKPHSGCLATVMRMKTDDGKSVLLEKPKGLEDHTAVGMVCAMAKDKARYIEVEFGDFPRGCENCEWFGFYDAKGKKLTDNNPAVLFDKEREAAEPGHGHYPNNEEMNALGKKLDLNNPDIQYIH